MRPVTSRKRREPMSGESAVVDALEPAIAVAKMMGAHTSEATAAPTLGSHKTTGAMTMSAVMIPGTPIMAESPSPRMRWKRRTAKVANRCGSSVASIPNAMSGSSHQEARTIAPPKMSAIPQNSSEIDFTTTSVMMTTPTKAIALMLARMRPITCHVLRRRPLARSASLSLMRCATTTAPRAGAHPRARRTAPRGSCRRIPRTSCPGRGCGHPPRPRRGRTCARQGP